MGVAFFLHFFGFLGSLFAVWGAYLFFQQSSFCNAFFVRPSFAVVVTTTLSEAAALVHDLRRQVATLRPLSLDYALYIVYPFIKVLRKDLAGEGQYVQCHKNWIVGGD